MNEEIRIKRGLSYGAFSRFDPRRDTGPFVVSALTKNESAVDVAGLIVDQLQRLGVESVQAAEMAPRKANLIGTSAVRSRPTGALVARIADLALYGLPLDESNRYTASIENVTPDAVQAFAAAHPGKGTSIVIVGDARKFLDALKKRWPDAEVIPIDRLDLNSPTLRK